MSADETEPMYPSAPADGGEEFEFAAVVRTIGHDLGAPLAAIRIAAEMLTGELDTPSLIEQGERLQRLTRHAEALVGDLVRVSGGQPAPELNKRVEPLAEVIREAVGQVAVSREVTLDLADVNAEVDRDAIGRAIVNVVTNAVRHTPRHTPVTVMLTADGDEAVIQVRDLGPGIPASERERVVRPFQRRVSVDQEQGVGLGLAIADMLVRAHGGTLMIERNDPQGTVVSVRLPVRSRPAAGSDTPGGAR